MHLQVEIVVVGIEDPRDHNGPVFFGIGQYCHHVILLLECDINVQTHGLLTRKHSRWDRRVCQSVRLRHLPPTNALPPSREDRHRRRRRLRRWSHRCRLHWRRCRRRSMNTNSYTRTHIHIRTRTRIHIRTRIRGPPVRGLHPACPASREWRPGLSESWFPLPPLWVLLLCCWYRRYCALVGTDRCIAGRTVGVDARIR